MGQSGSGVWIKNADGSRYVVAIHSHGSDSGNGGVRMSARKYAWVRAWRNDFDSPADLRATALAASLNVVDGEVQPGSTGTCTVTVANDGDEPATVTVRVTLTPSTWSAINVSIGSTGAVVPGLSTVNVSVPVTVPTYMSSGTARLGADVNSDRAFYEFNHANNSVTGPCVQVAVPWLPLTPGIARRWTLDFQEEGRSTFTVPPGARKLILRFAGHRRGRVCVEAANGGVVLLPKTKGRYKVSGPVPGEWRVVIEGRRVSKPATYRVKLKLK